MRRTLKRPAPPKELPQRNAGGDEEDDGEDGEGGFEPGGHHSTAISAGVGGVIRQHRPQVTFGGSSSVVSSRHDSRFGVLSNCGFTTARTLPTNEPTGSNCPHVSHGIGFSSFIVAVPSIASLLGDGLSKRPRAQRRCSRGSECIGTGYGLHSHRSDEVRVATPILLRRRGGQQRFPSPPERLHHPAAEAVEADLAFDAAARAG